MLSNIFCDHQSSSEIKGFWIEVVCENLPALWVCFQINADIIRTESNKSAGDFFVKVGISNEILQAWSEASDKFFWLL